MCMPRLGQSRWIALAAHVITYRGHDKCKQNFCLKNEESTWRFVRRRKDNGSLHPTIKKNIPVLSSVSHATYIKILKFKFFKI
jgi:hypothetical protein